MTNHRHSEPQGESEREKQIEGNDNEWCDQYTGYMRNGIVAFYSNLLFWFFCSSRTTRDQQKVSHVKYPRDNMEIVHLNLD